MRKPLIAGNWKMNMHWNEAMTLVADLVYLESTQDWDGKEILICPPSLYTRHTVEFLKNARSSIAVGVQNCASTDNGAYTGELSASMISQAGADAVIIGHSERRQYFNESDEELLSKVRLSIANGLRPIFCCGESLDERKSGAHFDVVKQQLEDTIMKIEAIDFDRIVIAYEPVWAIGTGETASPEQAQEMHAFIRSLVAQHFSSEQVERTHILYGGSMKPSNATELLSQSDVDGGLIGGVSLKAEDFAAIITA